ncbi:MAG: hypothetical protein R3C14_28215 [Caldilineaceae bacterium]
MKTLEKPGWLSPTTIRMTLVVVTFVSVTACAAPAAPQHSQASAPTSTAASTQASTPTTAPTATRASTPTPAPTATNAPTATTAVTTTLAAASTAKPTATVSSNTIITATPTAIPTPQVTIPSGWTAIKDTRLGYSLAVPTGWSELDLRGSQIATMAGMMGQGKALQQLQTFLATKEGQAVGKVALQLDMFSLMQGKIPPLLNVSVIPLPQGSDAAYVENTIKSNLGLLDSYAKLTNVVIKSDVVNNLPAVRASATADLSAVGVADKLAVTAVGLIANDHLYLLTMVARSDIAATMTPTFAQISGTFRPE